MSIYLGSKSGSEIYHHQNLFIYIIFFSIGQVCDKRKSSHHDPQDDDGEDNNVEVDVTTTKSPEDRPKVVKYLQHIGWFSRSTP